MSSTRITIKIDLRSCDDCAQRMKRLLRGLEGVESSSIDAQNGIVIISGRIPHPDKIIEDIRNAVKPVKMFSVHYDDDNDADDDDDNDADAATAADDVSEPATTPNLQSKNKNIITDDDDDDDQESRDRGGVQNKVHEHGNKNFCTGNGDQKGEGIRDRIFCCFRGKQPRAHKPKKKVHFADDVLEPTAARSMPSPQPNISKKDSGECSNRMADIDHKCKVQICQSEVHNCAKKAEGIHDQKCQCYYYRCKQPAHAEEPKIVQFADSPSFGPRQDFDSVHCEPKRKVNLANNPSNCNPRQDFDSVYHDYRNYPGMMGHNHGQIPRQHFENCPMAFRAQYFRNDSPSGCQTM